MKNLPFDPNVEPLLKQLDILTQVANTMNPTPLIRLYAVHLKPTKVLIDKPNKFKAIYKDDYGKYSFVIKKNNKNYTVISDNQMVCETDDKDYLIWNFENQLAAINPRILLN